MKLRSHLLWLTLATLLPLVVFGVTATAIIADRERAVFQRGAQERTLALLTALDTELSGHITSLRGLASSAALEAGDLQAFYEQARRTLPTQSNWRDINLALPSGDRLFQVLRPFGEELADVIERPSFEEALVTGSPTIGDLVLDEGRYEIPIRLPIGDRSAVRYVLTVMVDPAAVLALLSPQRLPSNWVGVVLDGNQRIVARTLDHASTLGQPASPSLRAALNRSSEGWFHGSTIEGDEVYTPFNRSSFSGWTVAMGIPAAVVEAASRQAVWLLVAGTLVAMLTALLLARTLAQRISDPIVSLASAATDLGRGRAIAPPVAGGVSEVNDVRTALVTASTVIREREEALKAADRAKDEFLAMLSHELRNPLGALASAAALLRMDPLPDARTQTAIGAIGRQVEHMTRLVDDLLDVSRVTSGKIHLTRQPHDLSEIVNHALRAMRSSGRLDHREVQADLSPVWVETDETRMDQIVLNLVGNAVKYTKPDDTIVVRVFAAGTTAVLQVEDSGAGIVPDLLPRIFDVFVQGDRSLDRRAGGLGIGLTLVKRLAELHGGHVTAESDGPGRGTRFTVVLPAIEAPAGRVGPDRPTASTAGQCRLLLIEDHDDARAMMKTGLELHGYVVFEAADGPSGVRVASQVGPEVVVVDLGLPGLDGYEVARQLRSRQTLASAFLIALTGYGQADARQRALDAGFDAHLTKPVAPDDLSEFITAKLADRVANAGSG